MRIPPWVIVTMVTAAAASPVRAQNYSTDYPVCLHVFDIGGDRIECAYTSMAQCAASASGRSALCMPNPYAVRADEPRGGSRRRDVR